MPKYDYECPRHGEFEVEHSVNVTLSWCPIKEKEDLDPCDKPIKRLLSPVVGKVVGGTPRHYR